MTVALDALDTSFELVAARWLAAHRRFLHPAVRRRSRRAAAEQGELLIASMAEVAGAAWRPEYARGWTAAFEVAAGVMLERAAAGELDVAA